MACWCAKGTPPLAAGMLKPGGSATMSLDRLQDCIEAAKMRHADVQAILQQSLDAYFAAAS